ncbi:Sec-independent protein translocase subunit TatA/TatB [Roseimarinus sediminis]|uniref:Sec-independent protein translocase subunit TatA/TatB n=1 Tax=Roseimarinus sediminis TaxID=1610899 RepID=UPI003D1BA23B
MIQLFISGQEIILILALALIFFGAKSIPEIARVMGKGVREFRKATNEIQKEFNDSTSDFKKNIDEVNKTVGDDARKIKENFDKAKNIKL